MGAQAVTPTNNATATIEYRDMCEPRATVIAGARPAADIIEPMLFHPTNMKPRISSSSQFSAVANRATTFAEKKEGPELRGPLVKFPETRL